MACHLSCVNPLSETMLTYHQLDTWEQTLMKFKLRYKTFIRQMLQIWFGRQGVNTLCPCESRSISWLSMMTSSNGNIFRVTGPLCGEFTGPGEFPPQRPVTRSFDVFFDLRLNKRSNKQPQGWWFETPSWSLWRQCNAIFIFQYSSPASCQAMN